MTGVRKVLGAAVVAGIAGVAGLWLLPSFAADQPVDFRGAQVVRVIDGDTFVVSLDGAQQRVRLIGIDAPETTNGKHECGGAAATETLAALVSGRTVELAADPTQTDRDRFDRLLRYVSIDGQDVGTALLVHGLVREYTYRESDPYVLQRQYRAAHDAARADSVGSWGDCGW